MGIQGSFGVPELVTGSQSAPALLPESADSAEPDGSEPDAARLPSPRIPGADCAEGIDGAAQDSSRRQRRTPAEKRDTYQASADAAQRVQQAGVSSAEQRSKVGARGEVKERQEMITRAPQRVVGPGLSPACVADREAPP
jgi:hypothetical protein